LYLWKDLTSRILTLRRLCTALPVVLLLPMLISSYGSLKLEIPLLRPYDWDASLARLERLINGGYQAWEWLQPMLGYPLATWSLNAVYNSWYLVFYGIFFWQLASTSRPDLRMRYLLVCVLQWAILGNLLGTLMSSAGPAFYGRLVEGSDPYTPLMQYLHSADSVRPIWALKTQDFLWQCYAKREFLVGCGISAMPSMHVATSFCFVLLAFGTSRLLGAVMSVYCALILIGSVQLGWHYVSDGYVAMIGTWLIWLSVGWLLNRARIKEWLAIGPLSQPVPGNAASRSQNEAGPPP
jgi:membrane-associated phospholipid phosphatase